MSAKFTFGPFQRGYDALLELVNAVGPLRGTAGSMVAYDHARQAIRDIEAHYAEVQSLSGHIKQARAQYVNDDVEIDDYPMVSIGDGGTWVSAWVWVGNDEAQ